MKAFILIFFTTVFVCCQSSSDNFGKKPEYLKTIDSVFTWSNYDWNLVRLIHYNYDKRDNLVETISFYKSENGWDTSSIAKNTYNSENLLVEKLQYWGNQDLRNANRTIKEYNDQGQEILSASQRWIDSAWTTSTSKSFVRDEAGKMLEEKMENVNNQFVHYSDTNPERVLYEYNTDEQLVRKIWQKEKDGQFITSSFQISEYDDQGRPSCSRSAYLNQQDTIYYDIAKYTYDDQDQVVGVQNQNMEENALVQRSRGFSEYDQHGNKIVVYGQSWINGLWVNGNKTHSTYRRRR